MFYKCSTVPAGSSTFSQNFQFSTLLFEIGSTKCPKGSLLASSPEFQIQYRNWSPVTNFKKEIRGVSGKRMSLGPVVLSYGDYVIRESELRLLQNKEWLNDVLIGFYLEYLGKEQSVEESKSVTFIGPEVAQLLKMISADQVPLVLGDLAHNLKASQYIFLPVNDSFDPEIHSGGSHWSLLIFSKIDNAFVHFDSSAGNSNRADAEQLFKKLRPVISTSGATPPSFSNYKDCLKQVNGYDCGVHVICNAQLMSQYVKSHPEASILTSGCPSVTPQDAKAMRSKLVELIQSLAKES